MSCGFLPYNVGASAKRLVGVTVYILLLLQMLQQGILAVEITVEVRRCRQNLAVPYSNDPLAVWSCSNQTKTLDAAKTAVIIVDMWDFHHCPSEHPIVLQHLMRLHLYTPWSQTGFTVE
jgi:hypothetical protein